MSIISVIIPVYNVEKYLKRCIESVIGQTFKQFELILIDDGSTDKSNEICQMYAKRDQRVIVITQKNGGAAAARNKGIDWVFNHSKSKWIAFIDSDDWVDSHYLELLYTAVLEKKTRISQCGVFDTDEKKELPKIKNKECKLLSAEEVNCMRGTVAPTRKLYAKECFKNVRYPEGKLFEDEFVTYKLLFEEEKIAFVDEPIYYYYLREGSLMHSKWNPKYLDALEAYKEQINYFEQRGLMRSQERSVKNMMDNIIVQFHNASQNNAYEQIRILKTEMRKLIRKYGKKGYGWISFSENQGAYEVMYPKLMWIYWVSKSKIMKLLGRIN